MVLPIIASICGTELGVDEARLLKKLQPVGISLFARNVLNKRQLKNLVQQIEELLGDEVLIAVDQEGVWLSLSGGLMLRNLFWGSCQKKFQ